MTLFDPTPLYISNDDLTKVRYIMIHLQGLSPAKSREAECTNVVFTNAILNFVVPWFAVKNNAELFLGDLNTGEKISLKEFDPLNDLPLSIYQKRHNPNIAIKLTCFVHVTLSQLLDSYYETQNILLIHALRFYHFCMLHAYGTKDEPAKAVKEVLFIVTPDGNQISLQEPSCMALL